MPIYEYRCARCQETFEILQRMSEGAVGLVCPGCGSPELAKQFSSFAATSSSQSHSRGSASGCGGSGRSAGFT